MSYWVQVRVEIWECPACRVFFSRFFRYFPPAFHGPLCSLFLITKNAKHKTFERKTPVVPLNFQADGLSITAAEPWFKVKVQLVQRYLQAFIMNAAAKADEIIFVDAFSGSGLYSTGHQKAIFPSVALTTLAGDLPIHRWIFCERDLEQAYALQTRVKKYGPEKTSRFLTDALPELDRPLPELRYQHQNGVIKLQSSAWSTRFRWICR